jgi:ATP-dependent helicase YprA (DUF1998 family)
MITRGIEALHERLVEYIEATYHIADPFLLAQRAALLDTLGTIRQPAYLESTKTYGKDRRFEELLQRLPPEARPATGALLGALAAQDPPLIYDPPYAHQWEAAETLLTGGGDKADSVVVYTGTGSGKTECFTTPILLRLLAEAATARRSFETRAVRALILYPMNALVNDQLSRIRLTLGGDTVANAFTRTGGRPATFGQYTGRTPFSGLRTFDAKGDGAKMKAFKDFYMDTVMKPTMGGDPAAVRLWDALRARGRWPSKPELNEWFGGTDYGATATLWRDRLHPRTSDRELIARHEFYGYRVEPGGPLLGAPPDVLVTNYSMLEYMLMRPIERRIFDRTKAWLEANPAETFFLVLDEAHLYRGAQGTEVALLVRRLLERLGLSGAESARVRVAVTSASFSAGDRAQDFAAQLVGFPKERFRPIGGRLDEPSGGAPAERPIAEALSKVSLQAFYAANSAGERVDSLSALLCSLGVSAADLNPSAPLALERALHDALEGLPVRRLVVALTQQEAYRIEDLAKILFPMLPPLAGAAATEALVALCAFARKAEDGANLLPSRVHSFHRGLPGLWLCINPDCSGIPAERRGRVGGAMFAQPRERCPHCEARVFELLTCRACGGAYARGYTSEWAEPRFIWQVGGGAEGDEDRPLPVDLLLEPARGDSELYEVKDINVKTGVIIGPEGSAAQGARPVGLYRIGEEDGETPAEDGRVFYRCGVCGDDNNRDEWFNRKKVTVHRSPVEDHQTAGQEPFYALAHEQLIRQAARAKRPSHLLQETPQRGRKLLVFSDGRQRAARLAAEMGRASLRDAVRPLMLRGFAHLQVAGFPRPLSEAYAALLVGAVVAGAQVRSTDDKFDEEIVTHLKLAREVLENDLDRDAYSELAQLEAPPPAATALLRVLRDKHTGLQALALARLEPFGVVAKKAVKEVLQGALPGLDEAARRALVDLWLGVALEQHGCDMFSREQLEPKLAWLAGRPEGGLPRPFTKALRGALGQDGLRIFKDTWFPALRGIFYAGEDDKGSLRAARVGLRIPEVLASLDGWLRCPRCSKVQASALPTGACVRCGWFGALASASEGSAQEQFLARKRFYRRAVSEASAEVSQPLVAREHSAQLTGASGDAHTRAERYELAFQDITEPSVDGMRVPIDVLSCTTTMEVGIDIGSLSGVALRNMPPGRANYQQRAGRAGRRGTGVATVVAYADQDGHNQHFFENPQKLVKAPVPDPFLNLSNRWIARRHVNAFVLQRYLAARVPLDVEPTPGHANLFGALGDVQVFVGGGGEIGLEDLEAWLLEPGVVGAIQGALDRWLPKDVEGRTDLIAGVAGDVSAALRAALPEASASLGPAAAGYGGGATEDDEQGTEEAAAEDRDTSRTHRLLDRLLYEGVLPKYAFPTDLVAFTVFERTNGLDAAVALRDKVRYAPQRNLAMALSEYAPGKVVFIDGRAWRSGALLSPMLGGLQASLTAALYMRVCERCHHTALFSSANEGGQRPCPACGDPGFGSGSGLKWIRPPGFGHPVTRRPQPDAEFGETARAGRAVLAAPSPSGAAWQKAGVGVEAHLGRADSNELIVTNAGPRDAGFRLCTSCGVVEPAITNQLANDQGHFRPAPNVLGMNERCETPAYEIVRLGTRFRTDVLLLRLRLPPPQRLELGAPAFSIAMSSLTEALTLATCKVLEIEAGEVLGGYRRGFSPEGPEPDALEIFLYDQLAGGAGYVVEAKARLEEILAEARRVLAHQTGNSAPPCDRACYGCLLSFKNSFEHHLYDRRLALDLLDAVQTQEPAMLEASQREAAYALLREWLSLADLGEVRAQVPVADGDGAPIAPLLLLRGARRIVPALAHPFAPGLPSDPGLAEVMQMGAGLGVEVVPLDYLDVIRALPRAARRVEEVARG